MPGGAALFTTRSGGVSSAPYESLNLGLWTDDDADAVRENRRRLSASIGLPLVQGHQVHGTDIEVWDESSDLQKTPDADAHITERRDLAAVVLAADCLPVAFSSESAVAIVHAGWRGIVDGILETTIDLMRARGAADDTLHAVIGPGAGPCCYEVAGEARERLKPHLEGDNADLKAAAGKRIADRRIDSLRDLGLCTICDARFFSHRRDGGVTGRQAGIVWRT